MLDEVGTRDRWRNAALGLIARLGHPRTPRQQPGDRAGERRSILLIRPDHLGDILFATPALTLLRRAFPSARISCLVGPWARDILVGNPDVDDILTCDFPWFNRRPRRSLFEPYLVLRQTARDLACQRFDLAINLRFDHWWGAWLAHMAAIPEIVGYDRPGCRPFLTVAVPYVPRYHEVEQNLRLVNAVLEKDSPLSREARGYPLRFHLGQEDEAYVDQLLAREQISTDVPVFAIHPGSGAAIKLWTADGFAEVARHLVDQHGGTVIITGSAGELPLAQDIARLLDGKKVVVLAGRTTLGQLAAVFARCAVVVGVDSGPMHLAVALGRPTVHLFGPSDPAAFGPYGDRGRHAIVSAGMECSPCGRLDITGPAMDVHHCMSAIEPRSVLAAVEEVLPLGG